VEEKMNIFQDNKEYFQKVIHVTKEKLASMFDEDMANHAYAREYTTLVFYNKTSKVARFEVAFVHPKMDRFSRKDGRDEVMKKLANEKAFMLADLSGVVTYTNSKGEVVWHMNPKTETKLVSKMLHEFTYHIVLAHLFGKQ
jgi:hypothetical protein